MQAKGFSLIELMVALTIIAVIIIIAVPSLKEVHMSANETWAVTYLRSWLPAQEMYKLKDAQQRYATSDEALIRAGFLGAPDPGGTDPLINGYRFEIRGGNDMGSNAKLWWEGYADPVIRGGTGRLSYYINSKDGALRYSEEGRANETSPPVTQF